MSRYQELLAAWEQSREEFNEFKTECRTLIDNLRSTFIAYWGVNDDRVVWQRYSEDSEIEDEDKVHPEGGFSRDRRIYLGDDPRGCRFALLLKVGPGGFSLQFILNKEGNIYTLSHQEQKWKIPYAPLAQRKEAMDKVVEEIESQLIEELKNEFQAYTKGTKGKLGFVIPE